VPFPLQSCRKLDPEHYLAQLALLAHDGEERFCIGLLVALPRRNGRTRVLD
jgi:hypothetical protein